MVCRTSHLSRHGSGRQLRPAWRRRCSTAPRPRPDSSRPACAGSRPRSGSLRRRTRPGRCTRRPCPAGP
ncbi:MAG TPA: hypothetical protein DEQ61_16255 [Streptomyces sp.]|nr:hypothetical protein [Streptomyces sp.]